MQAANCYYVVSKLLLKGAATDTFYRRADGVVLPIYDVHVIVGTSNESVPARSAGRSTTACSRRAGTPPIYSGVAQNPHSLLIIHIGKPRNSPRTYSTRVACRPGQISLFNIEQDLELSNLTPAFDAIYPGHKCCTRTISTPSDIQMTSVVKRRQVSPLLDLFGMLRFK
jgi:hypothetical protein